ncbi:hypothetical protein [Streptomyces sp. SID5910]|uniref:hypothetical protein n=1 Tax=Streptomyces sp. SID5910 TaxID=2690312 RepID=UPI00136E697B|nr:hypothetical protein [Streptomyces sp. SID5910]MYR40479.1 hypothetical protein [Streptomyces sp. SID5910]
MTAQENRAPALDGLDPHPVAPVVTGRERRLTIEQWLLRAADDERRARKEWQRDGTALLRCGRSFSAVRIPLGLVEIAAGTQDRQRMRAYLHEALLGVPFPGAGPEARSHWLVQLDSPDEVCVPDAVLQMLTFACFRAAHQTNG